MERSGYFVSLYEMEWLGDKTTATSEIVLEASPLYNLKNGQIDSDALPTALWQKLYRKVLSTTSLHNAAWQGEMILRTEIMHYVKQARGIDCVPEQVFIYSGTQQQLQALCTFFGKSRAAIEEPGFFRARAIFEQHHYDIQHVPIDAYGATIPPRSCQAYYVTPAHQYPIGAVMPIERKIALLQWAKENDCYIIEDDYDAEFRYKGLPIPPLAQLDMQHVIYFGTFSKTLIPALRMSYMILPVQLVEAFKAFYAAQKSTVSKLDQLVTAAFMQEGYYAKHIAKMRTLYRKKRTQLMTSLQTYLSDDCTILGDDAGLHVVIALPSWLDEQTAIQLAATQGIAIDAVSTCYKVENVSSFVMIGFGHIALENIDTAIRLLAESWRSYRETVI